VTQKVPNVGAYERRRRKINHEPNLLPEAEAREPHLLALREDHAHHRARLEASATVKQTMLRNKITNQYQLKTPNAP
jgi:hypothetical protein